MVRNPAFLLIASLSFLGIACTDNGDPGSNPGDGTHDFQGSIDPNAQTFVLQSMDATVDGVRVRVDLIGSNLEVDPESSVVALDVRVRNSGNVALYAPAEIIVHHLMPPSVSVE